LASVGEIDQKTPFYCAIVLRHGYRSTEVQMEVPLENPDNAQPGVIDIELTPEETARMAQFADDPEGLANFLAEIVALTRTFVRPPARRSSARLTQPHRVFLREGKGF
jgi:hypothetical protein